MRTRRIEDSQPIDPLLKKLHGVLEDNKVSLAQIIGTLRREHSLSAAQILDVLAEKKAVAEVSEAYVPTAIFSGRLSCLEAIVKYLKENKTSTFHDIGKLLKRNERSLWKTYQNAKRKMPEHLAVEESEFSFPLQILHDTSRGVVEAVVTWLHDSKGLTYHQIAVLMKRDDRSVWTAYNRRRR